MSIAINPIYNMSEDFENEPMASRRNMSATKSLKSDEIDLVELFLKLISIGKRYKYILLSALIVGFGAGLSWYLIVGNKYKSTISVSVPKLNANEAQEFVAAFNIKLKDKKSTMYRLAEDMELVGKPINDEDHTYILSAVVSEPQNFSVLRKNLILHFKGNDYLMKTGQAEAEKMRGTIKMLELQEKQLNDVLASTISTQFKSENFSVADMAKLKIDLYKERMDLELKLRNFSMVTVVQDFEPTDSPSNKNIFKIVGLGLIASFLIAAFLIAFLELKKNLHVYENPQKNEVERHSRSFSTYVVKQPNGARERPEKNLH